MTSNTTNSTSNHTASHTGTARRGQRAYLMMEAMISAMIFAVGLATVFDLIGSAQDQQTFAARDFVATQLAQQGLEISRAQALESGTTLSTLADCSTGSCTALSVPTGLQGTYTRTRTVSSGNDTVGTATALFYKDVTVTVSYVTHAGTRTVVEKTRIYERSRTDAAGNGT